MNTINNRPILISRVFGVPEITCDEQRLKFPTRKALALLIYLLIENGWHSREQLIALLWPDADDKRGRIVLRQTLKHLRQTLGAAADLYLEIEGDLIELNSDVPLDSDWHQLLNFWQQPDNYDDLADLEELLPLYRGDFLSTFVLNDAPDFELWVNAQRTLWQQRIDMLFDRLVKWQIVDGVLLKALDTTQIWLLRCPFSEVAYRALIQLHGELGNSSAALQAYEACRRMLMQQLNALPSPETDALITQFQKGTNATEVHAANTSTEYAALVEHYQLAQRGELRVVDVQVNGGYKTSLPIMEFLRWATLQNADVLQGQASAGSNFWIDLLQTRIDAENAPDDLLDDLWLSELAAILPELYERYPDLESPAALETDSESQSLRLFEAITRLGIAWAKRTTVVVLIENIHLADRVVLDSLRYVLLRWQDETNCPILVLLTRDSNSSANRVDEWLLRVPNPARLTRLDFTTAKIRRSVLHNLPAPTSNFVGRERELVELARLLDSPDVRLITIIGMGGMGKTRLALEAAYSQLECFRNGIYLVSLAPVTSTASLPSAIADAMHFQFYQGVDPSQQLKDYLSDKQTLLVLDNFEHLLEGVNIVREILQAAPEVRLLTTSRERLNIEGETLFHLDGLAFPDLSPTAEILSYGAVKLFLQNSHRLDLQRITSDEHLLALVRICQLLNGMPLGLLLAANWTEMLSLPEIAGEIERGLDFLETRQRDLPPRQRSLRAVFDHSWQLFTAAEQLAFMKLSVFRGGFTREAAETVTGVSLHHLLALVEKSILRRDPESGRFEIHELLRQYGAELLKQSGQIESVTYASYIRYFSELLINQAKLFYTPRAENAMTTIAADYSNIRAVWDVRPMHPMAFGLIEFFHRSGALLEMKVVFHAAVNQLSTNSITGIDLAVALCGLGKAHLEFGEHENCRFTLQWALNLLSTGNYPEETAFALEILGTDEIFATFSSTSSELDRALELYLQCQNRAGMVRVLERQTSSALFNNDVQTGKAKIEQAYELAESLQDTFLLTEVLVLWAYVALKSGDYERARVFSERGLATIDPNQYPLQRANGLNQLGLALSKLENYEQAELIFREVCEIVDATGNRARKASIKTNLCWSCYMQAKYQDALTAGEDALRYHRELQSAAPVIANDLCNLAHILTALGQYREAEIHFREALKLRQGSDDWSVAEALGGLANILAYGGQAERSVSILTMLVAHPRTSLQVKLALGVFLARLRAQLSPEDYAASEKKGIMLERELILQELIALNPIFN